jgi:hypothetical protein
MRRVLVASVVATVALTLPALASATHRHVLVTGNGACVVVAKSGNEPFVTLPASSFHNTIEPVTTANPHPLHVHVHRGEPGQHLTLAVFGSSADPCPETGNYLNLP